MAGEFCLQSISFILVGFFNILQHGTNRFTFPLKEVKLQIFNALKNPSSSAGFDPENLGSNGKHANH
jgi:hypothetical protein